MSHKGIFITSAILALAVIAGAWFYLDHNINPQGQTPGTQNNNSAAEAQLLEKLILAWPEIEQGPLGKKDCQYMCEGGHWFMDEAQIISSSTLIVHYDDGLVDGFAVLNNIGGNYFEVKKSFRVTENKTAELAAIRSTYGDLNYTPAAYKYDNATNKFVKTSAYSVFDPEMNIKIAFLNPDGSLPNEVKPGDISGCDHVVLQNRVIPQTSAPLAAALKVLLADKSHATPPGIDGIYNYLANGNLKLESVVIEGGVAKIRMTGTAPSLGGVCDDPRLFIQVAQTARQFPSVQKVQLFVNGVENTGSGNEKGE